MIVDTNARTLFDEGHYVLGVSDVPVEEEINGTTFWRFKFKTSSGQDYEEFCPIWLCGPLLKALDFPEVKPGRFDVEPTSALHRVIEADVVHETIEKGNKKGQVVSRLKNIVARKANKLADDEIPF